MPDDTELIKLITGRQQKLESEKSGFMDRMKEAAEYVAPHREDIYGTYNKGEKKGTKIFDGTAQGAAVLAADGIHGYHVSPSFNWFKFEMNRKEVTDIKEVREWLEDVEWYIRQALNKSNFYSEVWQWIYDGLTLGSPVMYAEEDLAEERICFEAIHPGEIYIAENQYGDIDVMHRKRKRTARQIVAMFGEDKVGETIKQSYKDNPFTEYDVLHAVYPREDYDSRMANAQNKKYASVWMLLAGKTIAKISGFDSFPFSCWRYMRSGKEPYAITPAMLAMADIKGINLIAKSDLGARQMALDPPLNVPSYLQGKVQWKPRGLNYVNDHRDKVAPINPNANFVPTDGVIDRVARAIKERFHVDTFLMLANLEGRGQRTAYEVSELMAEKAAVLGAELGPLNRELAGILDRVYDIEVSARRMPPPPDILLELAQRDRALSFDPVFMGPLAQAQKERFEKDGIKKLLTELGPLAEAKPEILDNFDLDELSRYIAKSDRVPEKIVVDMAVVRSIRKGRMEAQAEEARMQAIGQGADALQKASVADKNTGGALQRAIAGGIGA